jgi:hypothetical protein
MPAHPHVPSPLTRAKVEAAASVGMPQRLIASRLKIDPKTLRKRYRDELDKGIADNVEHLMAEVRKVADCAPGTTGKLEACKFLLEHSGIEEFQPSAVRIRHEGVIDHVHTFTDDELLEIIDAEGSGDGIVEAPEGTLLTN